MEKVIKSLEIALQSPMAVSNSGNNIVTSDDRLSIVSPDGSVCVHFYASGNELEVYWDNSGYVRRLLGVINLVDHLYIPIGVLMAESRVEMLINALGACVGKVRAIELLMEDMLSGHIEEPIDADLLIYKNRLDVHSGVIGEATLDYEGRYLECRFTADNNFGGGSILALDEEESLSKTVRKAADLLSWYMNGLELAKA